MLTLRDVWYPDAMAPTYRIQGRWPRRFRVYVETNAPLSLSLFLSLSPSLSLSLSLSLALKFSSNSGTLVYVHSSLSVHAFATLLLPGPHSQR